MKYIHRELEKILFEALDTFPCVAISGPRQSGKSTLLQNVLPKHKYVTLDDPLQRQLSQADPLLFLSQLGEPAIIDEIQYSPQLLSYIKVLVDQDREKSGRFVFTGSQSFQLIKNLGDSLAGRIALFNLPPFSILEAGDALETQEIYVARSLRGSYPELILHPKTKSSLWYSSYLQTYLERDIRSLYNIGNLRLFQQFLQLLAGRCSQLLNYSTFASDLGVSVATIKSWLSILEASQIIYLLPPYYVNLGKRITKSPKVYFLDNGLVCYLTGTHYADQLIQGSQAGALFENFCVQEVVKIFYSRGMIPPLYYLRTHNDIEVDLLVDFGTSIFPVEIKLNKTPSIQMGVQINKIRNIFSQISISSGAVVSLSESTMVLSQDFTAYTLRDLLTKIGQTINHAN